MALVPWTGPVQTPARPLITLRWAHCAGKLRWQTALGTLRWAAQPASSR
jgi:hypothetical protein